MLVIAAQQAFCIWGSKYPEKQPVTVAIDPSHFRSELIRR